MSVDLSQFFQTFFEESFENLDSMESVLLEIDVSNINIDDIHTIFRAAHSIKGNSATFGFSDISNLTHILETILDEMRDEKLEITSESVDILLGSVDCLRLMLDAAKDNTPTDTNLIKETTAKLKTLIEHINDDGSSQDTCSQANNTDQQPTKIAGWNIKFSPHKDFLKTGNDPIRLFRELKTLGKLDIKVIDQSLPTNIDFDPEELYLNWNLTLYGNIDKEEIISIFEWVEDDCDLNINQLNNQVPTTTNVNDFDNNDSSKTISDNSDTSDTNKRELKRQSESIRVNVDKIDELINLAGELVIVQSMLNQFREEFNPSQQENLSQGLAQLEFNTRELQEGIMRIRMLPVSFVFNRLPRIIHDLNKKLGKNVALVMNGENTEIDKTVMEKLIDPLVHIVRNSMDHGIEDAEDRINIGKPADGMITLNAYHQGGNVFIEISDDGKGLDNKKILQKAIAKNIISADDDNGSLEEHEISALIFKPGFSTVESATDVSGRGVGMDVVKKNITSLNGSVKINSTQGKGTTITIRLPLTLAILEGQLIQSGNDTLIIPMLSINESIQVRDSDINHIPGRGILFKLRDSYIPLINLEQTLQLNNNRVNNSDDIADKLLVVVEEDHKKVGLLVDDLMAQQQVVVKSIEDNFRKVDGVSGATILGNGQVAMIVDVGGIIRMA